jgi:23S rRNA (uracil1939-C5)-methyltransferase
VCPHRPACPGCPRFGRSGIGRRAAATLAQLSAEAGIDPAPVVDGAPTGFRHRARRAVRGRATSPKLGIFQLGTHRIVDIPRCPIHHPLVNEVATAAKAAMRGLRVAPYADRPHRGLLRYLQVIVERSSGTAQVLLVANDDRPEALAPLAEALVTRLGSRVHSCWWNGNAKRTNAILGPGWHRWMGPPAIREHLGGVDVFFPPGAFGQANASLHDPLVDTVQAHVPPGTRVTELYGGTGSFGLGLLGRSSHVSINEASEHGLWGLRLGLAARPASERRRASILAGPADAHLAALDDADVVIADPPRRGLDAAVLGRLAARPPARMILVSCEVGALDRDARTLLAAGLRLRHVVPFASFPYTEHVEAVAILDR